MDRAAFVFWAFAILAMIDIGLISMPIILARKGYKPRIGLVLGPVMGLVVAILAIVAIKPLFYVVLDAAQTVTGAVLDEEHDIIRADWDNNGTQAVVWTENDTASIYTLSQINDPSRYHHEDGDLEHAELAPGQQYLLTWGTGDLIEMWSVIDTKSPIYFMEHDGRVEDAIWNSDPETPRALSWTENGTVYIWNTKARLDAPLVLRTNDELLTATWGPEETSVLLWYADNTVRIWDLTDVAAGQRFSTTDLTIRERLPYFAIQVRDNSPAFEAGLRTGDSLLFAESTSFALDSILEEAGVDPEDDPATIQRAVSPIINALLEENFAASLEKNAVEFTILRQNQDELQTFTVIMPPISASNRTLEFSDFGMSVSYVGENPIFVPIGESGSDLSMPPWSPERDYILSWSVDNTVRIYEVEDPDSVITLPYSEAVIGALWGDNNEEVIFWTADEAFAWNLDDTNVAFRSTDPESVSRRAGFVLGDEAAEAAGFQPGDVLVGIDGAEIDVEALMDEYGAGAFTTRQFNRNLSPIIVQQLGAAAIRAGISGQPTYPVQVYRGGEIITLDIPVPQYNPDPNAPRINPPLFPALNIPFLNEETLGLSVDFINENPHRLPISGTVVNIAVSSENDYAALLTADNVMYIWPLQSDAEAIPLEGVTHAVWNSEGTHLLTWRDGTSESIVYNTESINSPITLSVDHNVVDGIWNAAGDAFVLIEEGDIATVWSIAALEAPIATLQHNGTIRSASWNPQENRNGLLTYLDNGYFYAWSFVGELENDTLAVQSTAVELNEEVTFADDLKFGINYTPIPEFEVLGARTNTLEFARAILVGLITFIGGYALLMLIYRLIPNRSDDNLRLGQRDMSDNTIARQLRGRVLQIHYFVSIMVGIIALSALMWNILKGTFTLTAVSRVVEPTTLTDGRELSELENDELADILVEGVAAGTVTDLELRSQVRDFVWGVTDREAAAQGQDPLQDTELGSALPEGERVPEELTFTELREPENVVYTIDLIAYNTDIVVLNRIAAISALERDDLVDELFDRLGAVGIRDFLAADETFWPEMDANPDEVYDVEVLRLELNLLNAPPEGITYNTLPDYPDLLRLALLAESGATNIVSRATLEDTLIKYELERVTALQELDRTAQATALLEAIGATGLRTLIVSQEVWIEIEATPDEPYDPAELQSALNLASTPPADVTFNTLTDYPELLIEIVVANPGAITDEELETALLNEGGIDVDDVISATSNAFNILGITKAPPQSLVNRFVAQQIATSVQEYYGSIAPSRLREILREYTWQVSTAEANQQADEPFLSVSGLESTPLVPDDLDFVYLRYDVAAMGAILEENLNSTDLETIVMALIVEPFVVQTWTLDFIVRRELLNDDSIDTEVEELNIARAEAAETEGTVWNDAVIEYRSWINFNFLRRTLNSDAELTGMRNAILGTLWMISITIAVAFPLGIGAAIYLEEYAGDSAIKRIIQTNIDNLAGVPSIIYGLLGVTLFVRALESITSGSAFGFGDPTTANGRTILSAALTMSLLILPIIIINGQEAIRAIQPSIRQASFGLGATKWQTVWNHVLPYAMPGILTGTILAMSRAIGETAPLVVVGAATFIVQDPDGPFSKFTALPMQIYFWTSKPRDADKAVAAAAIVVLLVILISLNSFAIILRNRFEKQVRGS